MSSLTSLNRATLIGNLGRDPDVRQNENGTLKVTFTMATNDYYKSKSGERISKTEWHNVALFGGLADLGKKYLVKGKKVYVEGKLSSRSYENKDGEVRSITEIVASSMIMLGSGKSESKDSQANSDRPSYESRDSRINTDKPSSESADSAESLPDDYDL